MAHERKIFKDLLNPSASKCPDGLAVRAVGC